MSYPSIGLVRWTQRDSNPRPPQCHCGALPAALWAQIVYDYGAEGTRTPDLYSAIVALSQLSYSPARGDAIVPQRVVNVKISFLELAFDTSLDCSSTTV
jgi:hypothetical protein